VGIVYWSFGLEGWFRGPLGPVSRAVLLAAGAMLIWPDLWVSVVGLLLGGAVLLRGLAPGRRVALSVPADG
jgi:TRAP-type uncharacterized transport system fused permease subunit